MWSEVGLYFILKQNWLGEDCVFEEPELGSLVDKVVKVLFEAWQFWVDWVGSNEHTFNHRDSHQCWPCHRWRASHIPEAELQLVQTICNSSHRTYTKNITTLFALLKHKIHQNLTMRYSFKFFQLWWFLSPGTEIFRKVRGLKVSQF